MLNFMIYQQNENSNICEFKNLVFNEEETYITKI